MQYALTVVDDATRSATPPLEVPSEGRNQRQNEEQRSDEHGRSVRYLIKGRKRMVVDLRCLDMFISGSILNNYGGGKWGPAQQGCRPCFLNAPKEERLSANSGKAWFCAL